MNAVLGRSGRLPIFERGICDGGNFTSNYNRNYIAAKIPNDIPNSGYLLRVDHIGVYRSHVCQPKHHVSYVQIKVQCGNGTPAPMAKATDPYANFSIYNDRKVFPMPGSAVWTGEAGSAPQTTTFIKEGACCCFATGSCKAANPWYSQCLNQVS
ncbi:carbohydrate-binding module family 1 protein [Karstenula rhodostoma CBS 690.94]|uniref:AA9 family lytic polysaccharide monooxygenase n=1 Tax=Karstenula rhodostoma CBS 690.94 TaxID=1392251 RepID=A0A9P4PFY5_9PLEO|nr:carbohydrate-binding module family 1 protein [Karstenula rhodostoma CBS 690.94]